jgi:hypothetical protein
MASCLINYVQGQLYLLLQDRHWRKLNVVRSVVKQCSSVGIISRTWAWSRDSSVGIATGYGIDGPGSIPGGERIFSSPQRPDRF